jgi:hypothetical protein
MPVYENINRQVALVFKQKNRTPLSEDCAASFSVIHELQIRDYTTNRRIITENSRITTTFFNYFHSTLSAVNRRPVLYDEKYNSADDYWVMRQPND